MVDKITTPPTPQGQIDKINEIIDNLGGGGSVDIDGVTITTNADDEIQTIAVIDNRSGNAIKTWTGTKAQYDAIITKDANTLYNITDDEINTGIFANLSLSNITDAGNIKMAHNAMPSDTYENLTLGASGTTYTAIADGYVIWGAKAVSVNQSIGLYYFTPNETEIGGIKTASPVTNIWMYIFLPVRKGQKFRPYYSDNMTLDYFRFLYAKGSESEAS